MPEVPHINAQIVRVFDARRPPDFPQQLLVRQHAARVPYQQDEQAILDWREMHGATIALDRARALVSLGQNGEAATALADARTADPDNAQAWLLSATLSRREKKLIEAQTQIEKAAQLAPQDAEVGLEAGVIAVLGGRDEAARRSWNAVVAMSPESPAAATAREYLAQLGPEGTPKP
jgi:Flp pilus assembly protein TadD